MLIDKIVKNSINENKEKIELIQWAIMSGISSLFYSEYIANMRYKEFPVITVEVPSIKTLINYLSLESDFMKSLSKVLIDEISNHKLIRQYFNAPELIMFNDDNIEIMKTIYDIYIAPNISRRIPETIVKKFDLNNPDQQTFRQNWEIDIFKGGITPDHIKFIIDQTALQLLTLLPSIKKETRTPNPDSSSSLWVDEILSINNENAICPIYFNADIVSNETVMKLLSFVTNTMFDKDDQTITPTTSVHNQLTIVKLLQVK